ncbi:MAG: CBS domain-containing protein [Phycisphaerae bacterium]|nr:CBS domain-containing protein [Phycisphaerae bacterium]
MPDTIAELETSTIEHAIGALDAFCEDIAGMFGIGAEGTASDQRLVTLKELKNEFKKVTAVFIVEGKGVINGNFFILLDQDALFTLAGTFVMLPDKIIVQNRRTGKEKEANEIADAVGEVGNLLVGAWDKYFREEMEGHKHFLQIGTFIGKPWLKPEENIGLAKETELVAAKYDMTIEGFDPFVCMAAFPKSVFEAERSEKKTKEAAEETTEQAKEEAPKADEATTETQRKEDSSAEKTEVPKEEIKAEAPADEPEQSTEKAIEPAKVEESEEPQAVEEPVETLTETEVEDRPVSKVIEQMTHSHAVLPGEITGEFLTDIQAQNVMRTDIAWATQDDTVENVLTKMQQQNTGYALIGSPNAIQGIVSKSDIQGALSPYLQAIFSKWKRELDTATLQIKVRWIMSRPVHTLRPDATLAAVMETMCKHSVRALPVADENGVYGIVTVYTIFNALTAASTDQADQQGQNTDVPALS